MPAGRPTDYTPEKAAEICRRIAAGESLSRICRSEGMPVRETVRLWRKAHPEFMADYAQARIEQAEVYFDDVIDMADSATPEDVQAVKLAVDSRKWVLARMDAMKYGDRASLNIGGQDGNPVKTESVSIKVDTDAMPDDERDVLLKAVHRRLQGAS